VFANTLVNHELREILSVQILARRLAGAVNDGVMFQTEPHALPNVKTLGAIVNAVTATKKLVHHDTVAKYL
jgi:hypothetical protein